MIFLIRHGERADDSTNYEKAKIVLDFDPHLSSNGEVQAKKTGKYIRNIMKYVLACFFTYVSNNLNLL